MKRHNRARPPREEVLEDVGNEDFYEQNYSAIIQNLFGRRGFRYKFH